MRFKKSYRPFEDSTRMASVTSGVEAQTDLRPDEFEAAENEGEEDEEGLQYDLWEGQFSLTSGPTEDDLSSFCPTKAIKNARNQRKLLDRWSSQDIDNLITEFDTLKGFDYDTNEKRLLLQRQMSSVDLPGSVPKNRMKNGDYTKLCWNNNNTLHEDLSEEVQMLQEQVGHLAESQATTDDKYSKVKQDNTSLIARIHMLEENIRELELRSDERLDEEQKRNKELLARLEREKHLEIENHTLRLQTLEKENGKLHQETANLRSTLEKIKLEKRTTEDYLLDAQNSLTQLQDEHNGVLEARKRDQDAFEVERGQSKHLINELTKEVEILSTRTSHHVGVVNGKGGQIIEDDPLEVMPSRIKELESEIRNLREDRRHLEEKNEELMGQILNKGLEEGKSILISTDASKPSIDHEIQEMSDNQIRTALKEQKDVNFQLRNYIDGILMNIIEKYPELLEVRK
ncbi:hypothetical protein TCAL_05088 [Tigriopus californicus]|uniref:FIP-RBD domain-containing protein n=1 Tax=Tigriopus californicus TaxID=6832 RepID=A0A553NVJ1_TIGCA|nr:hypothetical protein TCAL_05088 [Tigriopus californicus]